MAEKGTVIKHVEKLAEGYEEKKEEKQSSLQKLINVRDEVDEKSIKETAYEEGIQQLFTKDNLEMKTDLSPSLILAIARGRIYQKHFKSKVMGEFIDHIMTLSVSKERKGRKELVALVRNSQETEYYGGGTDLSNFNKLISK